MKLTLDLADLKPESREKPTSTVGYDDFPPEVQAAIRVVGSATYYTYNRDNYNAVYPPK
jgi:hypothetical protein